MSLYCWLKKLTTRHSQRKPLRPCHAFRPFLEPLEDRLALTTRVWTGGSFFSSNWSDRSNWSNPAGSIFNEPLNQGDSVLFPAGANRRDNNQDLAPQGTLVLEQIDIVGGNYTIGGKNIWLSHEGIVSEAGANTIGFNIFYSNPLGGNGGVIFPPVPPVTIDVKSGSLALTGSVIDVDLSEFGPPGTISIVELVKVGSGTLALSGTAIRWQAVVVQEGELALEAGGKLEAPLRIEGGATARVGANGNPFAAPVTILPSGVLDLDGHTVGIGFLELTGGIVRAGAGTLVVQSSVITNASDVSARIEGRLDLGSAIRTFTVANGAAPNDLNVEGVIQGSGGLIKNGPGRLVLSGSSANSYTGRTTVNEGTLTLEKSSGVAVAGELVIGDGVGGADADVVVLRTGTAQLTANAAVTVNASGLLSILTGSHPIGNLTLTGGHVATGPGKLVLNGDITTNAASTAARIDGLLRLQGTTIFTVANGSASSDLVINAVIDSGQLLKLGPGQLELTANSSYATETVVIEGGLEVNGKLANSRVLLNTGGTLSGNGTVDGITATGGNLQPGDGIGTLTSTDNVTLEAGVTFQPQVIVAGDAHDRLKVQGTVNLGGAKLSVQPQFAPAVSTATSLLDDSSAGFTSTAGFQSFTGAGFGYFGNTIHFAAAGNGAEQANYTFSNLAPGSYRVSAHWDFPTNLRASNAPFTIFNGDTAVSTVVVDQRVPAGEFSKFGFGWDALGIVQITGNSLTVRLTNNANGFVVADAIMLEPHHFNLIDNDGTDAVVGTFAGLPEGAALATPATVATNPPTTQVQIYTISYRGNDGNDVTLTYLTTATAVENLQATPAAVNEGDKVTLTGKLTDPDEGDFLTLTIDWGDGTSETHHPGLKQFHFSHRYLDSPSSQAHGAYTIHVTWFDQHNKGNSRDLSVTVHNVAPSVFLPAFVEVRGQFSAPGFFVDPGVRDRWTATVDYGDGTGIQSLRLNPAQHFLLHHRYQRSGTYRAIVTITDDDGESGTATLLVDVDLPTSHGGSDAVIAFWEAAAKKHADRS